MTTGTLPFSLWALTMVAFLAGRAGLARRLVATSAVAAVLLVPLTSWTGLSRPPMFVLAVSVAFAMLTVLGPVPNNSVTRLSAVTATAVLAGLLAAGALAGWPWEYVGAPVRLGDSFYRGALRGALDHAQVVLVALLLVAATATRRRGHWLAPAAVALAPWAVLTWLVAQNDWPRAALSLAAVAAVLVLVALVWLTARLAGVRVRLERAD